MIPDNILTASLAAASIAKILVDILRMAFPNRPSWVSPVLAIAFGILSALLLSIANGTEITQTMIAQNIIAGILAGGSSVALTEIQKRSN